MKIALVVHGFVQGVGYRYLVKRAADRLGVKGFVQNKDDGSVIIVAQGDQDILEKLESDINVSMEHGVRVHRIEKLDEESAEFPRISYDDRKFAIRE